jgi:predicted GNAT family acetyltransferase
MLVQNKNDGKRGAFFIEDGDKEIAFMHYIFSGDSKLVIDGVEYAREHKMKILPYCPYAKKIFAITPEFADVLF